eukprot:CAMPEP_0173083556 /NCGR_PEP_ID=MMETSP1102-20130122/19576_1 /TAXON_ID=49646 /ORGANISM="Geminigera sp., Strain Caron Lab Isolate" /LENGTH=307 /DNA_ID=CAMNT_0013960625 /DNA_START=216 /DNA_END=1139 /DNA_ORIENTATION=+
MSKDVLIGTVRMNLEARIGSHELLELPVLTSDCTPLCGDDGTPTMLNRVHVQDMGIYEPEDAAPAITPQAPAVRSPAAEKREIGGSAEGKKTSLFDVQEKLPAGSASVRKLMAGFESSSNPSTPAATPSATPSATPAGASAGSARWLEEAPPAARPVSLTGVPTSVPGAAAGGIDPAARPPKVPGPPVGVPGLGLGMLRERDSSGRSVAPGNPRLTSPRSMSGQSVGSRGSGGRRMGSGVGSPRISPRFQLAEGEDVSDAAQRMIATIRNRLVTSPGRTPSEGSVVSRDDVASPRSSVARDEKLHFV